MKVYRKTDAVDAEQFDGSNEMVDKYGIEVVEGVADKYGIEMVDRDYAEDYSIPEAGPAPYVRYFLTRFDLAKGISVGDWIATGSNGNHWTITDDVFKKTYAELPVIPKAVAAYIKKCKHDGIAIASAMDEDKFTKKVAEYFRNYYTRDQWIEIQDTFARAWLDGYVVKE